MGEYVKELITKQNNVFTDKNALHIINSVWGLPTNFMTKEADGEYVIDDNRLYEFLIKHPSMATKSIFFLATKLILTDKDRKIICSITWKNNSIQRYKEALLGRNFTPVKVVPLTNAVAKEDIVTFASVELYKKLQYDLLAVSYPGAQGDRCVLIGQGKMEIKIIKIEENGIGWFVIGLTYKSILEYLPLIQKEIEKDYLFTGAILIDQLLSAGNGKNRFIQCVVKNGKIDLTTAQNIIPTEIFKKITSEELRRNGKILDNSILTERQRLLIKQGCSI